MSALIALAILAVVMVIGAALQAMIDAENTSSSVTGKGSK